MEREPCRQSNADEHSSLDSRTNSFLRGGIAMNAFAAIFLAIAGAGAGTPIEKNPPVIAKMEELGTVYLTRFQPGPAIKKKVRQDQVQEINNNIKKGTIIGVDFRPMAGSDPKEVASVVKELATLPHLHMVLLLGQDVTDEAVDALPASVVNVRFFNTQVTDKGIAKLGRLKNLIGFNYTGANLTDEGMKELAKLKTLQSLSITDAKGVTDTGVAALASLANLQNVTIENTSASPRAVRSLKLVLPSLFELDFRNI